MKTQTEELQAYIPELLPTVAQIEQNPELLYSDHTMALYEIPLDEELTIRVLSWNILNPTLPSGYYPFREEPQQVSARMARIVDAIFRAVFTNKVDVIGLQENFLDLDSMASLLDWLNKHGEEWKRSPSGPAMFYKSSVLGDALEEGLNEAVDVEHLFFQQRQLLLANVHLPHAAIPVATEQKTKKLLRSAHNVVVFGDFNARIAPMNKATGNIITTVVPAIFRRDNNGVPQGQGCDWTDGAFCALKKGPAQQLPRKTINHFTGVILNDCPVIKSSNPFQSNELNTFGLSMHITEQQMESCNNEQFILDSGVVVRLARNAHNEEKIAVKLDNKNPVLNKKIMDHFKQDPSVNFLFIEDDIHPTSVILIAQPRFNDFVMFCHENQTWQYQQMTLPTSIKAVLRCVEELKKLFDDGTNVEDCRRIKSQLQELAISNKFAPRVYAKLALANYLLRFSEYNSDEFKLISAQKDCPDAVIRFTHYQMTLQLYLDVNEQMSHLNQAWLSYDQLVLIRNSQYQLGENIVRVTHALSNQFAVMIGLYDVAMDIEKTLKTPRQHYDTVAKTMEIFERVIRVHSGFSRENRLNGSLICPPIRVEDLCHPKQSSCVIF